MLILLAACESAPFAELSGAPGERLVVQLLDEHFVRIGDDRIPWEQLVYDMRTTCRRARVEGEPPPTIDLRISSAAASISSDVFDEIQSGLRAAGIRHLVITIGDA